MRDVVAVEVARTLQRAGLRTGHVLGSGVEGTVVDLGDGTVAKVWAERTRPELEVLRDFYDSVHELSPAIAMPRILELRTVDDAIITVERRLPGEPVWVADGTSPELRPSQVEAMVEALSALADVPGAPGLRTLPLLPGQPRLESRLPFEAELADLVTHRVAVFRDSLRVVVPDLEDLVPATVAALRELPPANPTLVHGDLIAANVLASGSHATGVLDFGFLSTAGDPAFDSAIAASCFDMYGPRAADVERELELAFVSAFGYDSRRLAVYRAAYALITACCFGTDLREGHFAWCVRLLTRPQVREALSV